MISWLMPKLASKAWLAALLLLGAVGSAAGALRSSIPNLREAPLLNYVFFGVIVGFFLSRGRVRGWWALPSGLILGTGAILFGFGGLGPPLLALLRGGLVYSYNLLYWSVHPSWKPELLPSAESVQLASQEILNSSSFVIYRLYSWLNIGFHGHWMVDVLATSILWSAIVCLCALWAAWMVFKARNPILGVAPAGLLMAFVLNYTRAESLIIVFFLGAVLLLMTLNMETTNEEHWKKRKIDFAEHIPQDVAIMGILLTIIFVLLATGAHAVEGLTLKEITSFFDRFRSGPAVAGEGDDTFAEAMGIEPIGKKVSLFGEWNKSGLPRQHLLGSGPELSQRIVMVVKPDQASLTIQRTGDEPAPPPRYYWRALTYDHYDGHGWIADDIEESINNPDTPLVINLPEGKLPFHASVRGVEDLANLLYYTGDLVNADKEYILARRPIYQGESAPLFIQKYVENDIFGVRINAQNYAFDAMLTYASEKSLRTTGTNYPDWIASRYMSLPAITPARLYMLTIGLTESKRTQYDKALAIQDYLRSIPYSLDVPMPPSDQDVADYFVFDLKKGYCDYYATAMVVMARAIGIPARLVMGYASGAYDEANGAFVVTEADAHSWPELYFPNIGWTEFEPTASFPVIQRPPDLSPEQVQEALQQANRFQIRLPSWSDILLRLGLMFLVLYIVIDLWSALDLLWLRRLEPEVGIRRIYQRLYRQARSLTGRFSPGDTPLEYSAALQNRIQALKSKPHEEIYFNVILERVRGLTNVYIQALFSPHVPGRPEFDQAIQTWKRLRRELISLRIRQTVRRIYGKAQFNLSKPRTHRA